MDSPLKYFHDISAYARVLLWGWGKTALYFVFLCALFAAAALRTIYPPVQASYAENIDSLKNALSEIKIEGGKVQPYAGADIELKDAGGNVYGIISQKFLDANRTKNLVFSIEGTRLGVYQDSEEVSFDLSSFDYADAKNLAQTLPTWRVVKFCLLPSIAFAAAISVVFWNAAMLGIFMFLIDIPRRRFALGQCLKLATAALTPALAVNLAYACIFGGFLPNAAILVISGAMMFCVRAAILRKAAEKGLY